MNRRILVVTLNPALDLTYELPHVDWAGVNRPVAVRSRPGGKGINVARTLHALGADVLVLGLAGEPTGQAVRSALAGTGVPGVFTEIAGETRRTLVVIDRDRGQTALFNEPGPRVSPAEYAALRTRYQAELAASAAVVLTGSLPPGLEARSYAELTAIAAGAGVPAVLDAEGEPLLRGLAANPAMVKPNLAELSGAVGRRLAGADSTGRAAVVAAALELREAGAQAVVVSLSPGTGCGRPRTPVRWRPTRPARATRWWPASPTCWCSASRGPNGCGTRSRSAPRRPPHRWPASSAAPTMSRRWSRSRWSGGTA